MPSKGASAQVCLPSKRLVVARITDLGQGRSSAHYDPLLQVLIGSHAPVQHGRAPRAISAPPQ
jgi:hypothetical protein